ncbi:MAG: hypothetical protein F6K00_06055 [Leptolyngbya sp. SIOISBB]|nr:hypothetical protein [Leptolyngbya sp. SIOISBB]
MSTRFFLGGPSHGGLSLLVAILAPFTLAKGALAQVQRLDLETQEFNNQSFVTEAADLQSLSQPESSSLRFGSSPLALEATVPLSAVRIDDWQLAPMEFATLEATEEATDMASAADPAIATANFADNEIRPAPIGLGQTAQAVLSDLEDYNLEPDPAALAQVNIAADTPADDSPQWRVTLWGGIMTDNDFEESLIFQGIEFEDSGLIGAGISRTLTGGNSITVEGELQLLQHFGRQDHLEGTAALALRWELSPSFSVAVIEGVSYATDIPEIEDDNNTDESQFLNYLSLEIEYLHTPKWGVAGRVHHRSGAFGLFGGAIGGSNAYLLGLRHRF